jgi:phospholipid/cholesterol/gamma-HCH transport system substrate-binding protein
MSENTHSVAIGAFIVGALVIAIGTALFLFGTGVGSSRERVVMVFDGSVKGLSVGAPVALRGVQIGQVTDINLILDRDNLDLIMMVEAEIDRGSIQQRGHGPEELVEELIGRGLRAQLNTQSLLTGLLYVQLDFHPDTPVNLADIESEDIQIPTVPTELQKLSRQIEDIDFAQVATDLRAIAAGLKTVIASDSFQALPDEVQRSLDSVASLSEELRATLRDSGPALEATLDEASRTLGTINRELPRLSKLIEDNLAVAADGIRAFEKAMTEVDQLASQDSPTTYELNKALRELAQAGRALQLLAKTLEEQPEALLRGKSKEAQ